MRIFLALIFWAYAYTEDELDKARACVKIVMDLFQNDYLYVEAFVEMKSHLDKKKLENKLFSDMIDNCIEKVPFDEVKPYRFFVAKNIWRGFGKYLSVNEKDYNEDKDLDEKQKLKKRNKPIMASNRII